MELKDFVTQTITSIIDGVIAAQEAGRIKGAHVNPGGLYKAPTTSPNTVYDRKTSNFPQTVAFDVALTVEEGTNKSAKVGVFTGIVGAGASGQSSDRNVSVSRVTFSVPVLLPVSLVSGTDDDPPIKTF